MREDEIIKLKRDNTKLHKTEENTTRKYAALNDARIKAEEDNVRLKWVRDYCKPGSIQFFFGVI